MTTIWSKLQLRLEEVRVGQGLKHKAARATAWLAAGSGTEQALRLFRNIVLTRLLAPEAFGLMAIVLAMISSFETFTEIGVRYAIIQNPKGREQSYLNGSWWVAFIRALGLYGLAYVAAPWAANLYANPELVPLLRVASLSIVANGAFSPRAYVAQKDMHFRKWVFVQNGGGTLGIVATVLLALALPGAWALVIGSTAEAFSRCILSHLICPFRPGFQFDRESWNSLVRYSRGVFGLPVLTLIFMQADIFVVGKLFSPSDLGIYSLVVNLAQTPFRLLGPLIGQVASPVFSEIQLDHERANRAISGIISAVILCGLPILSCVILYGRPFLHLLYGEQYSGAAVPFGLAFAASVLQLAAVPVTTFYFMIARPDLHRSFTQLRVCLMLLLIYPAVKWFGLVGAAAAGLISMSTAFLLQIARLRSITKIDFRPAGRFPEVAFWGSACIWLVWAGTHRLLPTSPIFHLLVGAVSCVLSCVFILRTLWSTQSALAGRTSIGQTQGTASLAEKEFWESSHLGRTFPTGHSSWSTKLKVKIKQMLSPRLLHYFRSYDDYLLWEVIYRRCLLQKAQAKALEVGSAPGDYLVRLWRTFGYTPFGIEYTDSGVEQNRKTFQENSLDSGNVIHDDFFSPNFQMRYREQFDVVISRGFIEHFDDVRSVIRMHANLVREGGQLVVSIPNFRGAYYPWLRLFRQKQLARHNLTIMQKEEFARAFGDQGFHPLFIGYYGTFSFDSYRADPTSPLRFVLHIGYACQKVLNLIFRVLLGARGWESSFFSPYMLFIGRKEARD